MYDNLARVKSESSYPIDAMLSRRRDSGIPARVAWANSSTLQVGQWIGSTGYTVIWDASGNVIPTPGALVGMSYNAGGTANAGIGTGTALASFTGVGAALPDIGTPQFAASNPLNMIGTPIDNTAGYVNTNIGNNVEFTVGEILITPIERNLKSLIIYMFDIVNIEQAAPLEVKTITTEEYAGYKSRELEEKFQRLVSRWQNEVINTSSFTKMVTSNATYQEIIGMGPDAIPLIFRQIESEGDDPDHWGWALSRITGEDPVPESAAGDTVKIAEAWLSWGHSRYVW